MQNEADIFPNMEVISVKCCNLCSCSHGLAVEASLVIIRRDILEE